MNPTRQVILSLFASGMIFVAAGDQAVARAGKVGTLLAGSTPTTGVGTHPPVNARMIFGWATLALFLVVGSELPGLGDLAAAFGWLIFLAIFLTEGGAAFDNLSGILNVPNTGGSGHKKK